MALDDYTKKSNYSISLTDLSDWAKDSLTATQTPSLIFCQSGEACIELNMIEYNLVKNSYVCIPNDTLLKIVSSSPDFNCLRLYLYNDTALTASIGLNIDTMRSIFVTPHNIITDKQEIAIVQHLLSILVTHATMQQYAHHTDFSFGIIRCLLISLADISARLNQHTLRTTYTSADNYFMDFIIMLNKHCRQQHDVAFYADKLNITPKYLNEITRKKAKHTAKDIITKFVVAQLKRELMISGNSVQRIAYDFNFCDQSSLGKFFKKATGMSPVAFRSNSQ